MNWLSLTKRVVVALVLYALPAKAQEPDAGVRRDAGVVVPDFSAALYSVCPDAPPAEPSADGGWWMPHERFERVACLMATCDVSRQLAKNENTDAVTPPGWLSWAAGIVTAVTIGVGVGRASR